MTLRFGETLTRDGILDACPELGEAGESLSDEQLVHYWNEHCGAFVREQLAKMLGSPCLALSDNDEWMARTFAGRKRPSPEEEALATERLQMIREGRLLFLPHPD